MNEYRKLLESFDRIERHSLRENDSVTAPQGWSVGYQDEEQTEYLGNVKVQLSGDNWQKQSGVVEVTSIVIHKDEDEGYINQINVEHSGNIIVYGDTNFKNAISKLLNTSVDFTEEGMQEDGYASMELG